MYGTFCDKEKGVRSWGIRVIFMRTKIAKQMKNGSNV